MNKCPICQQLGYNHAPDGRCDSCAEEHGCSCGCFPGVALRLWSEFLAGGGPVDYEKNNDGRWEASFIDARTKRQVKSGL